MADTFTTNLNLTKPEVGASTDTWGTKLNDNLDDVDAIFSATGTSVAINLDGAVIDSSVIGGTTPAAGTFTTLTANTSITGTLATAAQTNITSVGTLSSLTVSGEITANGGIALGDNDKATFGASDTFEIYTDGTDSFIKETAAGSLKLQGTNIDLANAAGTELGLRFVTNDAVTLYYDGSSKLATTSIGIGVTGGIAITKDGNASISLQDTGHGIGASSLALENGGRDLRMTVSQDIIFDTGTEVMRIDNNNRVGIGTSSPSFPLEVERSDDGVIAKFVNASGDAFQVSGDSNLIKLDSRNVAATVFSNQGSEKMRIDSSGNIGIGTTDSYDPACKFVVKGTGNSRFDVSATNTNNTLIGSNLDLSDDGTTYTTPQVGRSGGGIQFNLVNSLNNHGDILFLSAPDTNTESSTPSERMRIDSSGVLCYGTTSATSLATFETITANKMHVQGGSSGVTSPVVHFSDADGTVEGDSTILSIGFDNDSGYSNANYIRFIDKAAEQGVIEGAGAGSVTYTTSSDKRRKENIEDAPDYLEKIKQIGVKKYNFIGSEKKEVGMLAQDLYEIIPEPVKVGGDDENSNPWGIDYGKLTPFLIKAIQEQQEQIESLKSEIELLKGGQ